jgi:hypothetical protein
MTPTTTPALQDVKALHVISAATAAISGCPRSPHLGYGSAGRSAHLGPFELRGSLLYPITWLVVSVQFLLSDSI